MNRGGVVAVFSKNPVEEIMPIKSNQMMLRNKMMLFFPVTK
jgi:hypothetical protein